MKTDKVYASTDASIIYYNARLMSNINTGKVLESSTPSNSIAVFEDQRQSAVLDNPEDYYLSITRFTIDCSTLPLFIMNMSTSKQFDGVADDNITRTPYIITMSYDGFEYQQELLYTPEDKTAKIPNVADNPNLYATSPYFYVYTYQHLVDMINTAFKACFDGLDVQTNLPTDKPPFIIYDRDSDRFDIIADANGYRNKNYDGSDNPQINIYFNNYMYDLFYAVQADHIDNAYTLNTNLKDYRLRFENTGINIYDNTINIKYYDPYNKTTLTSYADIVLIMRVEWDLNSNICENSEVLFTTSHIPTASQYSSPFIPFEKASSSSIVNTFQKQLTDFSLIPHIDDSNSVRSMVTYVPSTHRYLELNGENSLNKIDIYVYWRSNRGALIPFSLSSKSVVTMKLMFIRKDIVNVNV